MGCKAQKIIGRPIKEFAEFAKKRYSQVVPNWWQETATFDYVAGISPTRGKWDLYTFRDINGKILSRNCTYADSGLSIDRTYKYLKEYGERGRLIDETSNMARLKTDKVIKLQDMDSSFKMQTSEFGFIDDVYTSTIARLEPGKPKKEILVKTGMHGGKPEISYTNVEGRLPEENIEYLPIYGYDILEYTQVGEIYQRSLLESMSNLEIKKNGLENLQKSLDVKRLDLKIAGNANSYINHVNIDRLEIYQPKELFDTVAHEYRHIKDHFDMVASRKVRWIKYYMKEAVEEAFAETDKSIGIITGFIKNLFKIAFSKNKSFPELDKLCPGTTEFFNEAFKHKIKDRTRLAQLRRLWKEELNYKELCDKLGHDNLEIERLAIGAAKSEMEKVEVIGRAAETLLGF